MPGVYSRLETSEFRPARAERWSIQKKVQKDLNLVILVNFSIFLKDKLFLTKLKFVKRVKLFYKWLNPPVRKKKSQHSLKKHNKIHMFNNVMVTMLTSFQKLTDVKRAIYICAHTHTHIKKITVKVFQIWLKL